MANFTFLYPMWFLALIPLVALIVIQRKNQHHGGLIAPHIAKQLGMVQKKNGHGFLYGLSVIWFCVTTALAGPSFGYKETPSFQLSGARILVMDMSRSLYATDLKPNRLTQAKYKAKDLLPYWKEGMTGLVAYANSSYLVSPLTGDSKTLDNLITNLSPEIMPYKGKGSNLSAAITQSIEMMKKSGHQQGDIVVLTDGISSSQLEKVTALVDGTKWRISLLGVGTTNGAPIELPNGQLLTDNTGKTVVAKLDPQPLQQIATETHGVAQLIQSDNSDIDAIVRLTKTPLEQVTKNSDTQVNSRANHGYWLLFPIVLLSLFAFRKGMILALLLVLLPVDKSMANTLLSNDYNAHQQYEQKEYQAASEQFQSKQWKGAAQYKAGDYKGAIESLTDLSDVQSQYNLANALAQNGQLEDAKAQYESLLQANPDMKDAQTNLDIVNKALEQQQNDKNKQSDKNKDNKEQDQNKDKQNNKDGSDQSSDSKDSQSQDSQQNQQNQQNQQKDKSQSENESKSDKQEKSDASSQEQKQQAQDKKQQEQKEKEKSAQASDKQKEQNNAEKEKKQAQMQSQQDQVDSDAKTTDPRLQKLEQSGAKEDELLRALLYLQAQQQEPPQASENEW
ncbi:VWA domain-containing protein [Aliivibrio fischeri]|uniref:VWA domain-containing protein n=1 Tax=Aliivibrio fischeri TaxID=668 RepID=UPI0012D9BAE0|nr:VWA domain-containing protein [Aliivibrio fischeri]MUL00872.1 VWA domain-containing protein [Aliivibrio fischeri]